MSARGPMRKEDMGFSIRIAPGVRVRASSRGVRTSIGPRIARVHVGAGRTGFSTGAGPIGYYTSLGGGSRTRGSRQGTGYATSTLASAARLDKIDRTMALAAALDAIASLHQETFTLAQRPVLPPPPPVDPEAVRKSHVDAALRQISAFKRAERRAATASAIAHADQAVMQETHRSVGAWKQEQAELDRFWAALLANDPATVMDQVASAFEDNAAPAAPLAVEGSEATLTVLVPDERSLPGQMPGVTAAGNPSIRKMTKAERDGYSHLLVCGYLLATVKEAFAVAPGLTSIRILAVRSAGISAYGERRGEAMAAAVIQRTALDGVRWKEVNASVILMDVASQLILNQRPPSPGLRPLDLDKEPEIAAIMERIDFDDLGEG